ncbi:hypothetical protein FRB94_001083 [Tulasnella sp. JGI-2019a]|nr:hypothetical protein FRB93_000421 [Tulasnella sp. JGI-2019a]KAG9005955.1 hypothetical protein FRB94_001083 [Tulasnella sp. JGI-2019a]
MCVVAKCDDKFLFRRLDLDHVVFKLKKVHNATLPYHKSKAKVPGEVIPLPADPYNFASTPRPFKNPSPEYLAKKATAQKRTKTVKVLLLAERETELAEIARIKKRIESKQVVKDQEMQMEVEGEEPKATASGDTSDMEIDDEEEEGNRAIAKAAEQLKAVTQLQLPMKEPPAQEDGDVLVCYSTIEAPPSLVPAKRYCDITGLEGPYTDPQTKLRYHDKDIFAHIRTLKPSAVQAYLALRGSGQPLII